MPGFVIAGVLLTLTLTIGVSTAQTLSPVSDSRTAFAMVPVLDDTGEWIYLVSAGDLSGANPEHRRQIFRIRVADEFAEQLTFFREGVEWPETSGRPDGPLRPEAIGPSVSDDGHRLAFVSRADPLGTNPDHARQLFVMERDGTGIVQLTSAPRSSEWRIDSVRIAGNGSRVVFATRHDLDGSNPGHTIQVWIVNADGSGLLRLSDVSTDSGMPSISDDGERVVFTTVQIWGVLADGSDLRMLFDDFGLYDWPVISGDGGTVYFRSQLSVLPGPACSSGLDLGVVDWDGSNARTLTHTELGATGCGTTGYPSPLDDGSSVVYSDLTSGEILTVDQATATQVRLIPAPGDYDVCSGSSVSGDGSVIAFQCPASVLFGDANPDDGRETYVMDGDGTNPRAVTDGVVGGSFAPDLTSDGTVAAFVSRADPGAEGGLPGARVYHAPLDGTTPSRLTPPGANRTCAVTLPDDGAFVVYASDTDPTTGDRGVFEVYLADAASAVVERLTTAVADQPHVSGDGGTVVFRSRGSYGGVPSSLTYRVWRMDADGTGFVLLGPSESDRDAGAPRADEDGSWVVFEVEGEIRRVAGDGTGEAVISPLRSEGTSAQARISADGARVAYRSDADPLGTNADGNVEIFLWDAADGSTRQLTDTTTGANDEPAISGDGTWVYFRTDAYFGGGRAEVARVRVADGLVQRVTALSSDCVPAVGPSDPAGGASCGPAIAVSHDGARAVFAAYGDCGGSNPDDLREVWLVDREATPGVEVSGGAGPTVVGWDAYSGPDRYDVVRGDLASLASTGTEIALGPVACIEDDSRDLDTVGDEDAGLPASGAGYFYLIRGATPGAPGPGSYGAGSAGLERVADSGDCPD